jgi:hypothetical protein
MSKGKARTAVNRATNIALSEHRNEPTLCSRAVWKDENGNKKIITAECGYPWWKQCKGNIFECAKLKYRYFASDKTK